MAIDKLLNDEYWEKRALAFTEAGEKSALEILLDLERVFKEAEKQIIKEIEAFYTRYSLKTGVPISELKLNLDKIKLGSVRQDIKRYYDEVKRLGGYSPKYEAYLKKLSARAHISRLEELQLQFRRYIENIYREANIGFTKGLSRTYENSYLRNIFNLQKGIGIGTPFTALNSRIIQKAISTKWLGENYSDRLWRHKDRLINSLNTTFEKGVTLGWNPTKIGREMAKDIEGKYSKDITGNAVALARTEFINIANQATLDGYKEFGVIKEYQFITALEEGVCKICGPLDGKHFPIEDAKQGINYPPIHTRCRCTEKVYFSGEAYKELQNKLKRLAKDPETGKWYYVPANMTYEQWKASLTESQQKAYLAKQKMNSYNSSDKEQFAKYKLIYGKEFPQKFSDFQQMKYLDPDKWNKYKADKSSR